jgi:acylphosphatase
MFHVKHSRRNPEDARAHIAVYGAVQGVGFRYFVLRAARAAGLAGWVLNRPDGAVELEVAGPRGAVEELLRTVENGPPQAHVERVETLEPSAEGLPEAFAIRH